MQDCIIIGGGPAGLTAALYLARFLRRVTVFDAGEGRAQMIPTTHNLGPFSDGISGPDLLRRMRDSAERYGARIEHDWVTAVERQGDAFRFTTERSFLTARYVILATGVFNHRPPLSAEDHLAGLRRGLIRYCPVCDAYEIRDKRVAVLGSGAHGLAEARFLHTYSPSVMLIPPDGAMPEAQDEIAVPDAPLRDLALSETQVLVTLATGRQLSFDTLYVALGTSARSGLATLMGAGLTENFHIRVDAQQCTSVDGVYAVGDVTEGLDQIAVAMGQAAIAATAIHNTLY